MPSVLGNSESPWMFNAYHLFDQIILYLGYVTYVHTKFPDNQHKSLSYANLNGLFVCITKITAIQAIEI